MSVKSFLIALLENGKVRVDRPREEPAREISGAEDVLRQMDGHARLDAPGEAPKLSLPSATWAALTLYRGAQLLVHRDASAEYVREAMSTPCPERPSADVVWSVDLTLRYLPDLLSLSRGVAEGDPLVAELARIAGDWPLSSIGVREAEARDLSAIVGHPCLRRLYADRVLERRDLARLSDARVRDAVREAIGAHDELWPEAAKALATPEPKAESTPQIETQRTR